MNKKYQAPKVVEVYDATRSIQGGKMGPNEDASQGAGHPSTTPGYSADE